MNLRHWCPRRHENHGTPVVELVSADEHHVHVRCSLCPWFKWVAK